MDTTTQFKSDLSNFLQIIKNSENLSEIKKEYVNLVKKYHPDTAPAELKQKYNEYMIIINKTYSQGKTNVKEVQIDENKSKTEQPAAKKVYSFNKNAVTICDRIKKQSHKGQSVNSPIGKEGQAMSLPEALELQNTILFHDCISL